MSGQRLSVHTIAPGMRMASGYKATILILHNTTHYPVFVANAMLRVRVMEARLTAQETRRLQEAALHRAVETLLCCGLKPRPSLPPFPPLWLDLCGWREVD